MKLLENKGFSQYKIGKISFIMEYDDIFKPIIIDGVKTRYIIDRLGNIYNSENKKPLIPQLSSGGYYRVQLRINNVSKSYAIHRLVAYAFISNPFNKPDINHIDGIKSHNYVENLEWVTKSENSLHAYRTGLNSNAGEINPKAKLTEQDVISIWNDINMNNDSFINIGKKYGVSKATISHIYKGDTWKELYNIYHRKNDDTRQYKYSDDDIKKARQLISENKISMKEISKITKINLNYLYALRLNYYRKE